MDIDPGNYSYELIATDLSDNKVTIKEGDFEIVAFLLNHGAKWNIKNKERKTPLDLAKNDDIRELITEEIDKKNDEQKFIKHEKSTHAPTVTQSIKNSI